MLEMTRRYITSVEARKGRRGCRGDKGERSNLSESSERGVRLERSLLFRRFNEVRLWIRKRGLE